METALTSVSGLGTFAGVATLITELVFGKEVKDRALRSRE
jgi:hypothetical protein